MRPLSKTGADIKKARPNKVTLGSTTAIGASIGWQSCGWQSCGWQGWNNTRPLWPRPTRQREDAATMVDAAPEIGHTKAGAKAGRS